MRRKNIVRTGSFRVVLVSSPEGKAPGCAGGVAICGGGTETLLAFVVSGVEDLQEDRDQKEEAIRFISITVFMWI